MFTFFLFSTSAFAQTHKLVVTYNTNRFIVKKFAPNWGILSETEISLAALRGQPTADAYHTVGAYQCMQLSADGNTLYFSFFPAAENDSTVFYRCQLQTKQIEKLFCIPRQMGATWQLVEQRNAVLYYDHSSSTFYEYQLKSRKRHKLVKVEPDNSNTWLAADSAGFEFVYVQNDSIRCLSYAFATGKATQQLLFVYPYYTAYHNGYLLVLPKSKQNNLTRLVNKGRAVNKTLPPTFSDPLFIGPEQFCLTEESALALYNSKLELQRSFYVQKPYLFTSLTDGILLRYVRDDGIRTIGFIDKEFQNLMELEDVHDNFFKLIAEY